MERVRELGRYAVLGPIATGGMAEVHVGLLRGTSGFERRVAIKRLRGDLAGDQKLVTMLLDEARMSACIHHPNVVSTLDIVVDNDDVFIVLEYVHGESLARLLAAAGGRAPMDIVASIVVGALEGLHAAHEAKDESGRPLEIIHRDVSPQNILVDTNGNARLLDFGVAKAHGRRQSSQVGALKGKVSYMAPEQVHGNVSRRSDVFSMGVVLWEALTGEHLFDGKSDGEILAAVMLAKIPPLRSRAPDVPEALEAAVSRSLRKNPEERFATAMDFAQAIESSVALAPSRVVADWVARLAADALAKRERLLSQTDVTTMADAPKRSRVPWLAALGAAIAAIAGGFALRAAMRSEPRAEPPSARVAEVPVESAAPLASDPEPEPEPAPAPSTSARPARRGVRQVRAHCDPPYTIDEKGHKIYKRDCF